MAQKDISEKILEDYNDVFADIINVLLFQGKREVKPEELIHTKIRSQYKADYFVKRRTGEAYQGNEQTIQHVDAVLKFMSVFAADRRFLELNLKKYEGRVNMCVILDKVEERGIQIGIKKVVENMLKNNFSEEMILKAVDITKEKLDEIKGSMKQ